MPSSLARVSIPFATTILLFFNRLLLASCHRLWSSVELSRHPWPLAPTAWENPNDTALQASAKGILCPSCTRSRSRSTLLLTRTTSSVTGGTVGNGWFVSMSRSNRNKPSRSVNGQTGNRRPLAHPTVGRRAWRMLMIPRWVPWQRQQ